MVVWDHDIEHVGPEPQGSSTYMLTCSCRVGIDVLHLLVINLHRHKYGKLEQHMTGSNPQPAGKCLQPPSTCPGGHSCFRDPLQC